MREVAISERPRSHSDGEVRCQHACEIARRGEEVILDISSIVLLDTTVLILMLAPASLSILIAATARSRTLPVLLVRIRSTGTLKVRRAAFWDGYRTYSSLRALQDQLDDSR